MSLQIKIESGIKVWPKAYSAIRTALRQMRVGQSFLVGDAKKRNLAYRAAERECAKIICRKVDGQGYRVWLTKRNRKTTNPPRIKTI